MSRKTIFTGLFTLSILFISTLIHADQYYDQYPGNGFVPEDNSLSYYRSYLNGSINHDDTSDGSYTCPVNFNVPDGSTYFIKSIGMRFKDNRTNGYIYVGLYRKNLYTGGSHIVASWTSSGSSTSFRTACQGTIDGFKLVDTKKFAYWLNVYFFMEGDINPSFYLILDQVRIHYGT